MQETNWKQRSEIMATEQQIKELVAPIYIKYDTNEHAKKLTDAYKRYHSLHNSCDQTIAQYLDKGESLCQNDAGDYFPSGNHLQGSRGRAEKPVQKNKPPRPRDLPAHDATCKRIPGTRLLEYQSRINITENKIVPQASTSNVAPSL